MGEPTVSSLMKMAGIARGAHRIEQMRILEAKTLILESDFK